MVELEPGMGCRPSKHARSRIRAAEAWGVPSSAQSRAGANSFSNGGTKGRFPASAISGGRIASASDFAAVPVHPASTATGTTGAPVTGGVAQGYPRRQGRPECGWSDARPDRAEFSEFSTTTATYRRPGAGTSRITVRLSKDGSTLEIEECELDSGDSAEDKAGDNEALAPLRPIRRSASSPAVCLTASNSSRRLTFEECCGRDKKLPSRPRTEIFLGERNYHRPKSSTADDVLGIISLSELEMFACECGQACENGRTACRSAPTHHRMGNVIVHKSSKECSSPPTANSSPSTTVQGECEVHASYNNAPKESRDANSEDDVTSVDKQTLKETCSSSSEKLEEMERHLIGRPDPGGAEDGASAAGPSSSLSARELQMEVDTSEGAAATTNSSNPPLQRLASTEAFTGSRTNVRRRPVNNPNRATLPANTEKRVRNAANGPPPHDPHSATALNSDPGIGMEEGDSCESLALNLQDLIAEVTYVHEDFINDFDDLFDDDITGVFSR